MYSTQLSDYKTYDLDNLILQPTEKRTDVRKIRLMTHNLDGTRGELIFSSPRLLSFGVQEIHDGETLVGYQMPLVLWGKNGPTPDEQAFADILEKISHTLKEDILHHREEWDKPDLTEEDMKRLNPLYYKPNAAPLLYVRLNTFRNEEDIRIRTLFLDDHTKQTIDPLTLLNRRCLVYAAVRLESVILGSKVRFQLKLLEARVRFLDRGFRSLLEPGKVFAFPEKKSNHLNKNNKE
jgi:hypothetical protein